MKTLVVWALIVALCALTVWLLIANHRNRERANPYEFSDKTKAGRADLHERAGGDRP